MAFYDPNMVEVHVLLVDNDVNTLVSTGTMLHSMAYKVTAFQEASLASSILSKGDEKFDILMVEMNYPDVERYKLVYDAVQLGLVVVLMSATADPMLVKCAIEDGAFLFMQKPVFLEVLMYFWQFVLREVSRKRKEVKGKAKAREVIVLDDETIEHNYNQEENHVKNNVSDDNISTNNEVESTGKQVEYVDFGAEWKGKKPVMNEDDNGSRALDMNALYEGKMKYQIGNEWSRELHERFMYAINVLGDGKCLPTEILKIMNVPGLTRADVAAHLQKCRRGWISAERRKERYTKSCKSPNTSSESVPPKRKRYGTFPGLMVEPSQPQFPHVQEMNPNHQEQILAADQNLEVLMPSVQTVTMDQQNLGTLNNTIDPVPNNFNMNYVTGPNIEGFMDDVGNYSSSSDVVNFPQPLDAVNCPMPSNVVNYPLLSDTVNYPPPSDVVNYPQLSDFVNYPQPTDVFSFDIGIGNNGVAKNNPPLHAYDWGFLDTDWDQFLLSQEVVPNELNNTDAAFWNSWMANIARDFGGSSG